MSISKVFAASFDDVKQRFAGSKLGVAWTIVYPIALILVYFLVFTTILRVQVPDIDSVDYVLMISSGLMPIIAFSEILGGSAFTFETNRSMLLNSQTPARFIPIRSVIAGQMSTMIGLVVCVLIAAVTGRITWHALVVPMFWLLFIGFMIGLAWIVSLLSLRIRDIPIIIGLGSTIILVASPVMYTEAMVPPEMRLLLDLNPLSYYVRGLQSGLAFHHLPPVSVVVGAVVCTIVSLLVGYIFFERTKHAFFDEL